jgi:hypothetical protein
MVRVQKLTAEALLSDPRRGPAVPNKDGSHALYTVSTHILGDKTTHELRVLNIQTGNSKQISNDSRIHDAMWIPTTELDIIYLRSVDKGRTQVMVAFAGDVSVEHYVAAEIDAPVSNLKLKALSSESVAFVVTGLVGDAGLYNQEAAQKGSTARLYDAEIPIVKLPLHPDYSFQFISVLTAPCSGMHPVDRIDAVSGTMSSCYAKAAGRSKVSSST